jgi:hypothetical protein
MAKQALYSGLHMSFVAVCDRLIWSSLGLEAGKNHTPNQTGDY